jgi:hypothetical protein
MPSSRTQPRAQDRHTAGGTAIDDKGRGGMKEESVVSVALAL